MTQEQKTQILREFARAYRNYMQAKKDKDNYCINHYNAKCIQLETICEILHIYNDLKILKMQLDVVIAIDY